MWRADDSQRLRRPRRDTCKATTNGDDFFQSCLRALEVERVEVAAGAIVSFTVNTLNEVTKEHAASDALGPDSSPQLRQNLVLTFGNGGHKSSEEVAALGNNTNNTNETLDQHQWQQSFYSPRLIFESSPRRPPPLPASPPPPLPHLGSRHPPPTPGHRASHSRRASE